MIWISGLAHAASAPHAAGQIRPSSRELAPIAAGNTPATGAIDPSSPSSPSTVKPFNASGGIAPIITGKLNDLERRRIDIGRLIDSKTVEHEELVSRQARYSRSREEIKQLVDRLQSPADEELFKVRAQIASQL